MLSCQPSAPGIGWNSGPHAEAVDLVVAPPAGETRQLSSPRRGARAQTRHPRRPARHSGTCNCTRRRNPRRCRAAAAARCRSQWARSQPTTQPAARPAAVIAAISSTWPVRYCTPGSRIVAMRGALALDPFEHVFGAQQVFARTRGATSIRSRAGSQAVKPHLGLNRVPVRGKRVPLDQQCRAFAGRPIEADEHEVQVGGQRVHRDDFGRVGADELREWFARAARGNSATDGGASKWPSTPSERQSRMTSSTYSTRQHRLRAERVAAEVDELRVPPRASRGNMKRSCQAASGSAASSACACSRSSLHGVLAFAVARLSGYSTGRLGAASVANAGTCRSSR